jgi:hypothetical protein
MSTIIARGRALLAALLLGLFTPVAAATPQATATKALIDEGAGPVKPPAGSPELGLLIIIGAVGFFVLVAWLFSRAGEAEGSYRSDGVTE